MKKGLIPSISMILLTMVGLIHLASCHEDESTKLKIGQEYQGGIIFYLDATEKHGLIAAKHDQSAAQWSTTYSTTNATGIAVGTGASNTISIVNAVGAGTYAASTCDQLVIDGYDDWFLPSRDELNHLYSQKDIVGEFATVHYWSSTESTNEGAWAQLFTNGDQTSSMAKTGNLLSIRAVRQF